MNLGRWSKDSFIVGLVGGSISLVAFYFLLNTIRVAIINHYENPYLMKPPTMQLITMAINVIIFRILVVNYDKEKTGKGLLFITVLATLGYFYYYSKFARQ